MRAEESTFGRKTTSTVAQMERKSTADLIPQLEDGHAQVRSWTLCKSAGLKGEKPKSQDPQPPERRD